MGSLPSPSSHSTPPSSPENSTSRPQIYVSVCFREPAPNVNISTWIDSFNPCNNTWSRVTSIPGLEENLVLKDFAMISIGDNIYIIGGRLCKKEIAHVTDESADIVDMNIQVRSTVLCYNVISEQWTECAPLHVPRYTFACTVYDNKIYVAGGQSTRDSTRGISSAEVYDPSLDMWTCLPNMSTLRYKCVGVTWQGKIHIVGGFAERGDLDRVVLRSSADVYDTEVGKWDHKSGMWQLDVPPNQIIPVDGKLFSSGDCLNSWKGHIEAYDGKENIWYIVDGSQREILSSLASTSYGDEENCSSIKRFYLTVASIGTYLYFLAAYRKAGDSSRTIWIVHVFDTSASGDAWKGLEPMVLDGERELCSHCCVVQLS
ncbi:uncharacterized protein LOC132281638 [Cornus florida]|uniref:uncharacterized protein LOC132281638 n=1 Tax=Cornus florida TaxID=4283 RepID=UPI0028A04DCF|nr:uncharacterized protein LOC132281638 [Cornus florida]